MISAFFDELEKIGAVHPANAVALKGARKKVKEMIAAVANLPTRPKVASVKQATMVKYTKPKPRPTAEQLIRKTASEVSRQANQYFGLPLHPPKRKVRRYENGPAAAESADRSMYPIVGDQSPNIAAGSVMTPSSGPGGV